MSNIIVLAAHPDDETLGCGGMLLRHRASGDSLHWLIATELTSEVGGTSELIFRREQEINNISSHFGFLGTHRLKFPAARLDTVARSDLVHSVSNVINLVKPDTIYLPFPGDVHSDHRIIAEACIACTKWFRYPWVRCIRAYETLSETEFQISPVINAFTPNLFGDITHFIDGKVAAMKIYESEISDFPFPRSEKTIRSLAKFRGSSVGFRAAEAFMTLREVI